MHIGRVNVITLLDYGATSSGISEELACLLYSYFTPKVAAGKLSAEANPVKGVEKYEEPSGMQGVGGTVMETRFAIKLQLEFVGIDKKLCAVGNPSEICSFKVIPKGESHIDGLVIGLPVLDREPFGFEVVNMDTCWYFKD